MAGGVIHVSEVGEVGFGGLLALRFPYNRHLVALVKAALASVPRRGKNRAGEWLSRSRCWSVDQKVWPEVRRYLLDAGVQLAGPAADPPKVKRSRMPTLDDPFGDDGGGRATEG